MRKTLLALVLLTGFGIQAQLYVGTGGYVYSNDQFIYVTQSVELNTGGNVYLRNQSQLLQGTSGLGQNSGLGSLSVFQEGTSDNFRYNYWCSPVGVPSSSLGNTNFGIALLNRPTGLTTSTVANVLPYNSYDGVASTLSIAQRWIYTFTTSNAYAQWNYIGSASTIAPGLGFTMKGTSGTDSTIADANDGIVNNPGSAQRYDFRGKPNDGNISSLVSSGNLTLVGNPYPSAIDLNSFLLDNNAVIDGTALFWEQSSTTHYVTDYDGGYGVYTPGVGYTPAAFWNYSGAGEYETNLGTNGTSAERRFAPVGQGFMVRGVTNGSVMMKNSYRVFRKEGSTNQSQFARTVSPNHSLGGESEYFEAIPNVANIDYTTIKKGYVPQLKVTTVYNNNVVSVSTLGFDENATDGFDYGFDGRSASESSPIGFYYVVDQMPYEYIIDVVDFDVNKRIPVGFRNNVQTNFKVKVTDALYGFDENQKVYIYDKQTGIYFDVKDNFFEIDLPAGDNRSRFEITFKNTNEVVLATNELVAESFEVYQNNKVAMLTVLNTSKKEVSLLDLYDVTGKKVVSKENLGENDRIEVSTSGLADGVYIVKLKTADGLEVSKKVSIMR